MGVSKDEYLSALVDDEVGRFEGRRLLDELSKSEEDRACWGRYHLIGEAMRGELPAKLNLSLAARIEQQIDLEPAYAPQGGFALTANRMAKPMLGFAMAASVAVVAVLTVQSLQGPADESGVGQIASEFESSSMLATQPVGMRLPVARVATGTVPVSEGSAAAEARLNSYLMNHSENAPGRIITPHVRIVGYRSEEQ